MYKSKSGGAGKGGWVKVLRIRLHLLHGAVFEDDAMGAVYLR